jgi:hypothetical protein
MLTTARAKIPKPLIGIKGLKQVPRKATKFVTEVAIMAPEAFLRVYATRCPKRLLFTGLPSLSSSSLSCKAGIYCAYRQVSLNRNVLSAPIPKTISTTKICRRQKNGIFKIILYIMSPIGMLMAMLTMEMVLRNIERRWMVT